MDYRRLGKSKQSLYNSLLTSESGFLSVNVRLDFQPTALAEYAYCSGGF